MKASISIGRVFIALFFLTSSFDGISQEYIKEISSRVLTNNCSTTIPFPKESIKYGNINQIHSAVVKVQIDLLSSNNDYVVGSSDKGKCSATFALVGHFNSGPNISIPISTKTIEVSSLKPISVISIDLSQYSSLFEVINIKEIEVVDFVITEDPETNLAPKLACFAAVEVEYSHGVTNAVSSEELSAPIQITPFDPSGMVLKSADFRWSCYYPFTLYQLQLLKLNNVRKENVAEDAISADINWESAITIDVPKATVLDENGEIISDNSIKLTISQGTGFYAWRVRPIGNYYAGGVADARNWGTWSSRLNGSIDLVRGNTSGEFFYFSDPDENINSIYSRTFTEQNKVKEVITYANNLNQIKQSKTYLATNDVTLTSQTISDNLGRAAIATLPIPLVSKNDGYTTDFATSGGKLYTSQNFDVVGKKSADVMDETQQLKYYNQNFDPRIPDALGVPFTQTTFYKEPSSRIMQEGGPGLLSLIKDDLSGKNVKYYYGTPNKSELLRLFGVDSPDPETVEKTVKVDPNGIAVISYIDSDGKLLASCVSFLDENSGLDPLATIGETVVQDEITKNVKLDFGFISSKRIVVLQPTPMKISYYVKSSVLEAGCSKVSFDCNYTLSVVIHPVGGSQKGDIVVIPNQEIKANGNGDILIEVDVPNGLTTGTYIVEKRLIFGNSTVKVDEAGNNVDSKIRPLVNLVAGMFNSIKCRPMYYVFNTNLIALENLIKSQNPDCDGFTKKLLNDIGTLPVELIDETNDFFKNTFKPGDYSLTRFKVVDGNLILIEGSELPDAVTIKSSCCEVSTNVKWIKKFDINVDPKISDENKNGVLEPKNVAEVEANNGSYEFLPDFEGYAMAYFDDCEELRYPLFYKYMNGWGDTPNDNVPKGTFNLMVYHMLKDNLKSYTYNSLTEQDKIAEIDDPADYVYKIDVCGNRVRVKVSKDVYTVKQLFECWEKQLIKLRSAVGCDSPKMKIDGLKQPINVADEATERNDGQDNVKDMVKKAGKKVGWLIRGWVKRRINKKLRGAKVGNIPDPNIPEEQQVPPSAFEIHLVRDFLDCAGYTFVKILTPYNPEPILEDKCPSAEYSRRLNNKPFLYEMTEGTSSVDYFSSLSKYKKETIDYFYYPLVDWGPKLFMPKDGSNDYTTESQYGPFFKNIRNPIFAFKYFEYPQEGSEFYAELEGSNCYSDPNDCYQMNGDYIMKSDEGGFSLGPCCTYVGNDFCYEDKNYPNIDKIVVSEGSPAYYSPAKLMTRKSQSISENSIFSVSPYDSRFRIEPIDGVNTVTAKYIVDMFDNGARVKCPYDHYSWSSGQRMSFYKMLNQYIPDNANERIRDVDADFNSCRKLETPLTWYENYDDHGNAIDRAYDELITGNELARFTQENGSVALVEHVFTGITGGKRSKFSPIEMDLVDVKKNCLSTCRGRADEFRTELVSLLIDNCYDINGCKTDVKDNVISDEDIEAIVNNMVKQCESQCDLNTYACIDTKIRYLDASKTVLGPSAYGTPMFFLGVGDPEEDKDKTVNLPGCNYNGSLYTPIDFGKDNITDAYSYNIGYCPDIKKLLSWRQSLLVTQATSWAFDLSIPSKCDSIRFFAERASAIENARKGEYGIEKFGSGSLLRFNGVDFGVGVKGLNLMYAANEMSVGTTVQIVLENGNSRTVVGEMKISNTDNVFTSVEIPLTLKPITGIHDLVVEGKGSVGARNCKINWITLKGDVGVFSNIQDFTADPNNNSTFMERSTYYKESIEIPNSDKPLDDNAVKSPAITITSKKI